ncbi:MAG: hypothetical protein ACKN9U_14045, partial [Pirellulaceae bacterium]
MPQESRCSPKSGRTIEQAQPEIPPERSHGASVGSAAEMIRLRSDRNRLAERRRQAALIIEVQ